MVCYVVLFAALNYWQVGQKQQLDARFDNTRSVLREFNKPRGQILTADGVVVANHELTVPGWTRLPEPDGVKPGRYYLYRSS